MKMFKYSEYFIHAGYSLRWCIDRVYTCTAHAYSDLCACIVYTMFKTAVNTRHE